MKNKKFTTLVLALISVSLGLCYHYNFNNQFLRFLFFGIVAAIGLLPQLKRKFLWETDSIVFMGFVIGMCTPEVDIAPMSLGVLIISLFFPIEIPNPLRLGKMAENGRFHVDGIAFIHNPEDIELTYPFEKWRIKNLTLMGVKVYLGYNCAVYRDENWKLTYIRVRNDFNILLDSVGGDGNNRNISEIDIALIALTRRLDTLTAGQKFKRQPYKTAKTYTYKRPHEDEWCQVQMDENPDAPCLLPGNELVYLC